MHTLNHHNITMSNDTNLSYAEQLDHNYSSLFIQDLHKVPLHILQRYFNHTVSVSTLYTSFLHFKQLSQFRHYHLVSQHIKTISSLNTLNSNISLISQETKNISQQNKTILNELVSLRHDFISQLQNSHNKQFKQNSDIIHEISKLKEKIDKPQNTLNNSQDNTLGEISSIIFDEQPSTDFNQIPLYLRTSLSLN